MATESFGASFGNPRQYMGSSPLGEIWKGLKTGATVYGMEKSGLVNYLDKLGVKQNNGVFSFNNTKPAAVSGAVAPLSEAQLAAGSNWGAFGGQSPAAMESAVPPTSMPMGGPLGSSYDPMTGQQKYGDTGVNKEYAPPNSSSEVQMGPPLTGKSILDGTSSVDNPNDWNPAQSTHYTDVLASGNEYKSQPGYGKTSKLMSSLFGMA